MRRAEIAAAGVGLVLVLVLVLGACGGEKDDNPGGGGAILADVNALAAAVSTQTANKNSAHITFELTGGAESVKGEGSYRLVPDLAGDFAMRVDEGPNRFIVLDKTIYMQLPEKDRKQMGVDKPWVRFVQGGADIGSKVFTYVADSMIDQADITKQIEKMKAAGAITKTAKEELDGQQTTHYTIEVEVAKLIEIEQDMLVKAGLEELKRKGVTKIPYELWLSADNLPLKIVIDTAGPGGASGKVTMRWDRWGEPVDIKAPPADQVADPPNAGG